MRSIYWWPWFQVALKTVSCVNSYPFMRSSLSLCNPISITLQAHSYVITRLFAIRYEKRKGTNEPFPTAKIMIFRGECKFNRKEVYRWLQFSSCAVAIDKGQRWFQMRSIIYGWCMKYKHLMQCCFMNFPYLCNSF